MVDCESVEKRCKILSFMQENYIESTEFFDKKYLYNDVGTGPICEYDENKQNEDTFLGFHYRCLAPVESGYMYSIMRWVALKVGTRKQFPKINELCPYIIYDGHDEYPVIVNPKEEVHSDLKYAICEKDGWAKEFDRKDFHPLWMRILKFLFRMKRPRHFKEEIKAEIARLDKLWEENQKSS
jgi:hypothetical protein